MLVLQEMGRDGVTWGHVCCHTFALGSIPGSSFVARKDIYCCHQKVHGEGRTLITTIIINIVIIIVLIDMNTCVFF